MLHLNSPPPHPCSVQHPGKMTCQMLMMAGYAWFEAWKDLPSSKRGEEYDHLKETWKNRALALLFRYYPQLDGRIDHINISSPLSIEHYISASQVRALPVCLWCLNPPRLFTPSPTPSSRARPLDWHRHQSAILETRRCCGCWTW